jgi:hypothetical protein
VTADSLSVLRNKSRTESHTAQSRKEKSKRVRPTGPALPENAQSQQGPAKGLVNEVNATGLTASMGPVSLAANSLGALLDSAARRKLVNALLTEQWLVVKAKERFLDVAYPTELIAPAEKLAAKALAAGNKHRRTAKQNDFVVAPSSSPSGASELLAGRLHRRPSMHSLVTAASRSGIPAVAMSFADASEMSAITLSGSNCISPMKKRRPSTGPAVMSVPISEDSAVARVHALVYYPDSVSPERFRAMTEYNTLLERALYSLGESAHQSAE